MASFPVRRVGTILAVADVGRSVAFYTERFGFTVEALYEAPAYATLVRDGVRLSLAEQGHPASDLPGFVMTVPADPALAAVALVLEVEDARACHAGLAAEGATFVADPYEPPWGGCRFFVVDPDRYLVEVEQPA
jgi:catechol 2,3-dioxygenase-like lactoylglutathione lyase family enzyme